MPLHQQTAKATQPRRGRFTGHEWSQRAPCQPAVQVQDPSAGLHFAPLAQWQVVLHPGPQVPSEQGAEHSGPCQPADAQRARRPGLIGCHFTDRPRFLFHADPDCVIILLPSLQKQVPSIGEQSTKFSQAHSREQFLP